MPGMRQEKPGLPGPPRALAGPPESPRIPVPEAPPGDWAGAQGEFLGTRGGGAAGGGGGGGGGGGPRTGDPPSLASTPPAIIHHRLVLYARAPEELDLLYEGVKRHVPPPAGSVSLVPAGSPALWRWSGRFDWLHISLEPGLVARVAAEAFGLDPARMTVPPLDGLDLPHLRATMWAAADELTA